MKNNPLNFRKRHASMFYFCISLLLLITISTQVFALTFLWNPPQSLDSTGDVGQFTSLAVVNGVPAVSYIDESNDTLKFIIATDASGTAWNTPQTLDSVGGFEPYTSLAVVNGVPAISYYDSSNDDLKFIRAADANGTAWNTPQTLDNAGNVGAYTSLAVVNGVPAISYYDTSNGDLKFIRAADASGISWNTPQTLDNAGDVGQYTSLAVVNGVPAISYYNYSNGVLKFIRAADASGISWNTPQTLDNAGDVGQYTSLAVVNGMPAISYYDSSNWDLKFIRATDANGTAWNTPQTLDSWVRVGRLDTSLAVVNGVPAISYFDYLGRDLKFIRAADASGTAWNRPQTLDSTEWVGQYTSLAVVNGVPAISYYDLTNGDLKFIRSNGTVDISVWEGATQINTSDTLDFGSTTLGVPITTTLTIRNTGTLALDLHTLILPDGFSLTGTYPNNIISGDSKDIHIRLDALQTGTFSGNLQIGSADTNQSLFRIALTGVVTTSNVEIVVWDGTTALTSASSSVDFGSTVRGTPLNHTFRVENTGTSDLALGNLSLPAGFSLVGSYDLSVAGGASTNITVKLDAATTGIYSGTFSLDNQDADENPFTFAIYGEVTEANGEIAVSEGGSDIPDGSGSLDYGTTLTGSPLSHTFTIANSGAYDLNLYSLTLPDGFSLVSSYNHIVTSGGTTTLNVRLDAFSAGSYGGAFSLSNNDADENPYNFTLSGVVSDAPGEISVWNGAAEIPNVTGSLDFGSTPLGTPVSIGLTVRNDGTYPLDLGTINLPAGFSLVGSYASPVASSTSTTLTVRLDALSAGSFNGTLSLPNDDTDENPFTFTIYGEVTEANGEIAVSEGGSDIPDGSGSLDYGTTLTGSPLSHTFTIANSGAYDLNLYSLTLPDGFSLVSSYNHIVTSGGTTTLNVRLDAFSAGSYGGAFSLSNNDADENPYNFTLSGVVSDAPGEISVWNGAAEIPDGTGSLDFGSTPLGTPVSIGLTVRNDGTYPLDLGTINLPAGFSLVGSYASPVASGASTSLTVRLDALSAGSFNGMLSLPNDDTDENPFTFTIYGTVTNLTLQTPLIAPVDGSTVLNSDILVSFNQDVLHDGSAEAADNPDNYLLVEEGTNNIFDTSTCLLGLAGDDVQVTINSVTYDSSRYTAVLNTASLPSGSFQLLVCGTASIEGLNGNVLNNGLFDSSTTFSVVASGSGGASSSSTSANTSASLPATGFAPDQLTNLPNQPAELAYTDMNSLRLQIPALKVDVPIVGVPQTASGWDVTWLTNGQAGWLNGSAYPTWEGNTVLTGHVSNASGNPGPFARIKSLKFGDEISIQAYGEEYVYEVRENKLVTRNNLRMVNEHKDHDWITLITCETFNENTGEYLYRRVVRAVLVEVE